MKYIATKLFMQLLRWINSNSIQYTELVLILQDTILPDGASVH